MTVHLDVDAVIENVLYVSFDDVCGQSVFGNADSHHPAQHPVLFEDSNTVTHLPQFQRCRQTGRPGTDHGHFLAVLLDRFGFLLGREFLAVLGMPVGQESFDVGYGDRAVQVRSVAALLARMLAYPAANRREGVGFGCRDVCLFVLAGRGQRHVPARITMYRAAIVTRSHTDSGHREFVGNGLRIFLEDRLSVAQKLVVLVRDRYGTVLGTNTAAGTFLKIDEVRLDGNSCLEVARFARQLGKFGVGDHLDISVCPGSDQPGRYGAHRTVVRGERLVELGHVPADSGSRLDEIDLIT